MKAYIIACALITTYSLSAMYKLPQMTEEEMKDFMQPFTPENELTLLKETVSFAVKKNLDHMGTFKWYVRCEKAEEYYRKGKQIKLRKKITKEKALAVCAQAHLMEKAMGKAEHLISGLSTLDKTKNERTKTLTTFAQGKQSVKELKNLLLKEK